MIRKMGVLIAAVALWSIFPITGKGQAPQSDYSDAGFWLSRIEEWRKAVEQHQPGQADSAAIEISNWPFVELQFSISLFKQLIKRPLSKLSIPSEDCRSLSDYLGINKEEDKNYWLKRGALLHADIALLQPGKGFVGMHLSDLKRLMKSGKKDHTDTCRSIVLRSPVYWDFEDKGDRIFAWIQDGKPAWESEGPHMKIGRYLLASVTPNPSQDEMVRQWYIATSAYGLSRGRTGYIEQHLKEAANLFPSDALILFYAGILHEEYATSHYQNARISTRIKYSFGSKKAELELARKFFQRAVTANPNFAEARLRLGHVSGLLGYHSQAVAELETAISAISDPQMLYFAALFLGNELAVLDRIADACKQFERAASLYPSAQSPLLALSHLAYSNGDIQNASVAIERVFTVAIDGRRGDDPRWKYQLVPYDKAAALLLEMRKDFGALSR